MNKQQAKDFIDKIYSDLVDPNYLDRIPEIYHSDFTATMGGEQVNYHDVVARAKYRIQYYQSIDNHITHVLVDSDMITARVEQVGKAKHEGKPLRLECLIIYQIKEDKVIQAWGDFTPQFHY